MESKRFLSDELKILLKWVVYEFGHNRAAKLGVYSKDTIKKFNFWKKCKVIQKSAKDPNQWNIKKKKKKRTKTHTHTHTHWIYWEIKENSLLSSISFIINPSLGCPVNWIFRPNICRSVREREPVWYRAGCTDRQSDSGHSTECCTGTCYTRYYAVVKGFHRQKIIFCRITARNVIMNDLLEEKIIHFWVFFIQRKNNVSSQDI